MKKRLLSMLSSVCIAAAAALPMSANAIYSCGNTDEVTNRLNENYTCVPEFIEPISDIMKLDSDTPHSFFKQIDGLWLIGSSNDCMEFNSTQKVDDYICILLNGDEALSDEEIDYIKSYIGYNDKFTLENGMFSGGSGVRVCLTFNSDDHMLNYMISEKFYYYMKENHDIINTNAVYDSTETYWFKIYIPDVPCRSYAELDSYTQEDWDNYNKLLSDNGIRVQYRSEPLITYYGANLDREIKKYAIFPDDMTDAERMEYCSFVNKNFCTVGAYFNTSASVPQGNVDFSDTEILYNHGDANCDGSMDLADAVFVMQSIASPQKYPLTAQGSFNGDIDAAGNGITSKDALAIQRQLLGISPTA